MGPVLRLHHVGSSAVACQRFLEEPTVAIYPPGLVNVGNNKAEAFLPQQLSIRALLAWKTQRGQSKIVASTVVCPRYSSWKSAHRPLPCFSSTIVCPSSKGMNERLPTEHGRANSQLQTAGILPQQLSVHIHVVLKSQHVQSETGMRLVVHADLAFRKVFF